LTLKTLRKEAGLTMKEVATTLGVSAAAVDHYEGGRRVPDPLVIEAFVRACGRDLVVLVVEPGAQIEPVTSDELALLHALRELPADRREALTGLASALPHAREGAAQAALAVLERLQEAAPTPAALPG
jgi:transcriptional regulator with XRE-family HTH domain